MGCHSSMVEFSLRFAFYQFQRSVKVKFADNPLKFQCTIQHHIRNLLLLPAFEYQRMLHTIFETRNEQAFLYIVAN